MSKLVFVLSIVCMKRTTEVNYECRLSSDLGPTIKFSTTPEWTKCLFLHTPICFFLGHSLEITQVSLIGNDLFCAAFLRTILDISR